MSRHIIAQESEEKLPTFPYIVKPGSLIWPEHDVYVFANVRDDISGFIGVASDMRREENGDVTVEVEWVDQVIDSLAAYANEVHAETIDGVKHITSATVRYLFFSYDVPWGEDFSPGFPRDLFDKPFS